MRKNKFCDEIIDIDDYVHIVRGKIICFTSDVYDLSVSGNIEALLWFASDLYVDPMFPAYFGKNTVCRLYPTDRDDCRCDVDFCDIKSMDMKTQMLIRSALDVYD